MSAAELNEWAVGLQRSLHGTDIEALLEGSEATS